MGDDEHRAAARGEVAREPVDALDVEVVRRLVEQQQLGVAEQRLGQRDPAPLAAATAARSACPARSGSAPSPRRRAARRARSGTSRRRAHSWSARPPTSSSRIVRAGSQVVALAEQRQRAGRRSRVTAPASGSSMPAISRSSVDLPSPLRPTIADPVAGRDAERDVVQHGARGVALGGVLEVDQVARRGHRRHAAVRSRRVGGAASDEATAPGRDLRRLRRRVRRADRAAGRRSGSDDYANEALEQMRRERIRVVHRGQRAAVLRPHRPRRRRDALRRPPRRLERRQRPARRSTGARRPPSRSTPRPTHDPQGSRRRRRLDIEDRTRARLRRRAARDRGRGPPDRGDRRGHHAPARGRDAPDHLDDHARPVRADQPRQRGRARHPGRARHRARPRSACTARRGCCTPTRSSRAPACWSSARTRPSSATSSRCCRRWARAASSSGRSAR